MAGRDTTNFLYVFITTIAGCRQDQEFTTGLVQAIDYVAHCFYSGRVVCVVKNDFERMFREHIHAARSLEERGIEGSQAVANIFQRHVQTVGQRGGEHGVLYIVQSPAFERCRNQMSPQQRNVIAAVVDRDHVSRVTLFQHDGSSAALDMLLHEFMRRVHGDVTHMFRFGVVRHLQAIDVVRVEHDSIPGNFNRDSLDFRKLFECIDAA